LAAVLHINKSNAAGNNKRLYTSGVEELIIVFTHNVINLHFTANNSTVYTSCYDEVYHELP